MSTMLARLKAKARSLKIKGRERTEFLLQCKAEWTEADEGLDRAKAIREKWEGRLEKAKRKLKAAKKDEKAKAKVERKAKAKWSEASRIAADEIAAEERADV